MFYMREQMVNFARQVNLLPALIIACLLLTACMDNAAPAKMNEAQSPGSGVSDLNLAEVPPTTAITVTRTAAEANTSETERESTVDRAAASPERPTRKPASAYADLEIVTLLPRDAIPAIDNPQFLSVEDADEFYDPDELVMGVSFNGDSRAYSAPFLSNHEIVNDTVGGVKIAVTW